MYKLSDTILEVLGFEVNKTKISIIHKNVRKQCVLKINQEPVLQFEFRSLTRGLHENFTVVSDVFKTIYIFNSYELVKKIDGFSLSEQAYSQHEIIISKRITKGTYEKYIYDVSNYNSHELQFVPSLTSFKSFYFEERTTLKSLSLFTGEYEWEVDLGVYGEIDKIIGVCNDILWVGVGSKMLIGIDVKYGKIIHLIDKPSHFAHQSGTFNYFRGHDGQIDEKVQKIVGFEFDTYYELDLVTMEFTYWIFREEAKAMKIEARYAPQNIYKEEFIYFIDKLNFKIGIFDRKNKTIKEAYVFPENSCTGFLNDMQITDDKLYVLDSGGTLHIFEKEQS